MNIIMRFNVFQLFTEYTLQWTHIPKNPTFRNVFIKVFTMKYFNLENIAQPFFLMFPHFIETDKILFFICRLLSCMHL